MITILRVLTSALPARLKACQVVCTYSY